MIFGKKLHRLISFFLSFCLLFQSFAPAVVYAADEISSPSATVDQTPTDTLTPSPTPTETPTLTPEITPTETVTPTPTPDATLTPEVTPTPTVEVTVSPEATPSPEPTLEPTQAITETSPPAEPTLTVTPTPILTPEVTPTPTPTPTETITQPTVTTSTDLLASLITDKLDYYPTDTVNITGSNLAPFQTYIIVISSTDDPAVTEQNLVLTGGSGSFTYSYQLDGNYRPNYKVEVKDDSGNVVASTTFTDDVHHADAPSTKLSQYANIPLEYQNGNLNGSNAAYGEGQSIPYRYLGAGGEENSHLDLTIKYQYKQGSDNAFDFLTSDNETQSLTDTIRFGGNTSSKPSGFAMTTCTNSTTVSIPADSSNPPFDEGTDPDSFKLCSNFPLSGVSAAWGGSSGDDKKIILKLTLGSDGDGNTTEGNVDFAIFFGGHLAVDSDWPGSNNGSSHISGSPFHMRTDGFVDDNNNGTEDSHEKDVSGEDRSVQPGAVVVQETGSLTIHKQDQSQNPIQGVVFAISGTSSANGSTDVNGNLTFSNIPTGGYTITETVPTNYQWTSTSGDCSNANPASVTITAQGKNCTFVNTRNTGTIIVHKDVQGPNGEDVTDISNNSEVSLDGGTGQVITDNLTVTYNNVPLGSHTITESLIDPDYTLYGISSSVGGSGNTSGLTITVTSGTNNVYVTNRQHSGTITVIKDVVGPTGGPISDSHSFTVNLSPGSQSSSFAEGSPAVFTVNPGHYTVTETADPAYLSSPECLTAGGKTDIVVDSGQGVTITCTNQQKNATLHVIKTVVNDNGGTKTADNFSFQLNGGTVTPFEADGQNDLTITPNTTYNVTEPSVSGYATSYSGCSDISVAVGGSATCTITNDDIPPSLQLIKAMIINAGGTASPTDWNLTATGTSLGSTTSIYGLGGVTSGAGFNAGSYDLSESAGPVGYLASQWSCVKNGGSPVLGSSITLGLADSAICTVTNSDLPGQLTVIKNVIGSGNVTDFSFSVNGGTPIAFKSGGNVLSPLSRGTYTVTEVSNPDIYVTSYSDGCNNVFIDNGGSATCTITNTRNQGTITFEKLVDDDSAVSGWTFSVNGVDGIFHSGDSVTLDTGTYFVTEAGSSDYTPFSVDGETCTGLEGSTATLNVTENGGTCTFTNHVKRGSITVTKITNPTTSEDSFDFSLDHGDSSDTTSLSNGESHSFEDLLPGNYSLSEDHQGWDLTTSCSDNQDKTIDPREISLTPGETINCTFTNTQHGSITIVKDAQPDSSQEFNFDSNLTTDGFTLEDNGNESHNSETFSDLSDGQYTFTEAQTEGWNLSDISCQGSHGEGYNTDGRLLIVNLDPGENVTYTYTNNQSVAPRLTLAKSNNAAGDKNPGDAVTFTLTLTVADNDVTNAKVIDLPAKGFKYRPGSWIVFSNLQGFMTITQPAYNSPGDWNLGSLAAGEIVTLSYIADIDSSETPGLYKDLAWANANSGTVIAAGSDGAFVGTEVNVNKNLQDTPSVNVINETKVEGQVLGASTDILPATGANTNILMLAILGLLTGVSLSTIGSYFKKKYE